MSRKEYHSKWITVFLVIMLIGVIYFMVAIFISGPYYAMIEEDKKIENLIQSKEEDVISVERHSFAFVTYVCECEKEYVIYDEKGERLLHRDKDELQLDKVKTIMKDNYSFMEDYEIHIGYGYDSIAYIVSTSDDMVVIDFDSLEVLFDTKEGKYEIK